MPHDVLMVELIPMDFINIRPTKIEAAERPPNKLDANE
jgi:hypothetical protein